MMRRIPALVLAGVLAAAPAAAVAADNPWLQRRVLHFAHQGGEFEAPSNTLYAFKTALRKGADVIELDVNATADDRLVVLHDRTLDRTTNGSGPAREHTLAEIRALDAAHNFVPGRNAVSGLDSSAYPFRGVRTGAKPPPVGFRRKDFRVPTLREVLRTFPSVPTNVEIKGNDAEALHTAGLLAAELLRAGRMDVVVVSFNQAAVDAFHAAAPLILVAPGIGGMASYILAGGSPGDGVRAFQVPLKFTVGSTTLDVATPELVSRAHGDGYAVHVWLDGSEEENEATYARVLDMCADGVMTAHPTRFERFLRTRRPPRPGRGGHDDCGQPAPPCTVRPTAFQPAARILRLARLDASKRRCPGRVVLRDGEDTIGDGVFTLPHGEVSTMARVRLTRHGRRVLSQRSFTLTAIAKPKGIRSYFETFSIER
jgi:glycerophosphoryl diester phosphodiesterase